jgi:regulatory protein
MKITGIKQQVRNGDRYSVYIDGRYSFGLSSAALLEQGLAVGQTLEGSRLAELKKAVVADNLYNQALRYVAIRQRSVWEMSAYLERKGSATEETTKIISRLQNLKLLDDQAFASAWLANRRQLKHVSRRRLVSELRQKHVAAATIEKAMSEDVSDDRSTLRELASKKKQHYPDRIKLTQYLIRQGFGYDDIKSVLDEE